MTVLGRSRKHVSRGATIRNGGPLSGQEYFRIRDQSGQVWYWWISFDLAGDWGNTPETPDDREVRFFFVPWWLTIRDSESVVWYVYPEVDGSPLARISQPPVGDGIANGPALRVRGGNAKYKYAVVGGDLDVVSA